MFVLSSFFLGSVSIQDFFGGFSIGWWIWAVSLKLLLCAFWWMLNGFADNGSLFLSCLIFVPPYIFFSFIPSFLALIRFDEVLFELIEFIFQLGSVWSDSPLIHCTSTRGGFCNVTASFLFWLDLRSETYCCLKHLFYWIPSNPCWVGEPFLVIWKLRGRCLVQNE